MRLLLVVAHPRAGSLTHRAAAAFARAVAEGGHEVEMADLMAEGFDPVLRVADEPDWADPTKPWAADVVAEMARIERNEATVLVFPVWWWSMPAILKGWIDRVWANGWAYGGRAYPHARVWALALVGGPAAATAAGGFDRVLEGQIVDGTFRFCGVAEPRLALLHDAAANPEGVVAEAARLGAEF